MENIFLLLMSHCHSSVDHVVCDSKFTLANENEYLGSYATPLGHSYLSHPWKTYINHMGQKFPGTIRGATEFIIKLKA
jgi:hypothetical protein